MTRMESTTIHDVLATRGGPPIRPRWEWRVFEPAPSALAARICPGPTDGATSHEIYLLSAVSPHNVKVRHGQLDVKLLECTDANAGGPELWRPVFKHAFPIPAAELAPVWTAWALAAPTPTRASYTLDELLTEVVATNEHLRAACVSKTRRQLTVADCRAECASLSIDGARWDTVALEDEDPLRVGRAKASLGTNLPRSTNYPAFLKQVVGIPAALTLRPGSAI